MERPVSRRASPELRPSDIWRRECMPRSASLPVRRRLASVRLQRFWIIYGFPEAALWAATTCVSEALDRVCGFQTLTVSSSPAAIGHAPFSLTSATTEIAVSVHSPICTSQGLPTYPAVQCRVLSEISKKLDLPLKGSPSGKLPKPVPSRLIGGCTCATTWLQPAAAHCVVILVIVIGGSG